MAKLKKRGASGQAKNFITRTQAVRKLQISLPDFRRLCIFKGIYPREPRNKKKASKSSTPSTTFYYTKDIQYLLHEPLLQKFRDHKALAKKISRALGRGEVGDAARLEKTQTPRLTLDNVIKERYPTFVDALRDLDDALSMLFLFANLPSTATIPPKTISLCQRLCHEFEHYLIVSHSLRKSFLSIKGIYYQATIQGQDIMWLVPYKFVQRVTGDIDFRIMGTFVEFYTTLLGFVNFRLYTSIGLIYPPRLSLKSDEEGGELGAFILEGRNFDVMQGQIEPPPPNGDAVKDDEATQRAQAAAQSLQSKATDDDEAEHELYGASEAAVEDSDAPEETATAIDTFTSTAPDADSLPTPQSTSTEAAKLFAPCTFYLSRETPRHAIELLLKAFGCRRVGWPSILGEGAYTTDEFNPAITHQVVDRPPQPVDGAGDEPGQPETHSQGGRYPGRTYVQPQWVWDSVNAGKLQRPDLYAPGATLPPHLSPWVKPSRGEYDPTAPLLNDEDMAVDAAAGLVEDAKDAVTLEDSHSSEDDDLDEEESDAGVGVDGDDLRAADEEEMNQRDWSGFSDGSNDDDDDHGGEEHVASARHQADLEAETAGEAPASRAAAAPKPSKAQRELRRRQRAEQEDLERRKMMMPRRKRKLYEKMAYGNAKRDAEAAKLTAKRRRIEAEQGPVRR